MAGPSDYGGDATPVRRYGVNPDGSPRVPPTRGRPVAAPADRYWLAVDLGRQRDPTAIAGIRRTRIAGERRPVFEVGFLRRLPLATAYPAVRAHVRKLLREPPFDRAELVLDATGVGLPVADEFEADRLRPIKVMITAGSEVARDAADARLYRVAKQVLVSTVSSLLNEGRLRVKRVAEAAVLREELHDFESNVTDSGRWTFGAREGKHDDLLLAVAMGVWRAADDPDGWFENITDGVIARASVPGRRRY